MEASFSSRQMAVAAVHGEQVELSEMLEVRRQALGAEHSDTLVSAKDLASLLAEQGEFSEAARIHRETLEVVTGQLGRPLSETPEFWRAAPEAAVQWSAEEFEFPPEAAEQSRGTNLGLPPPFGDGAVEPEDSPLAVGLLRASGMQI